MFYVNGRKVTLTDSDFVFKGGEATIYEKSKVAYKIYLDQSRMIPEAKIKELQCLDDPRIINPQDIIFDNKKKIVGFTMQWIGDDTVSLCKLFTNNFRDENGIENDHIIKLVENIKGGTISIHSKKCLIVDGNELNYMVDKDFVTPYFIDVNCYQTPSFPASAIAPTIRDWKSQSFSPLTDWFSFAIVTFQLFIGVHPFRGGHPNYGKNDYERRVIDCVSVFNPKVSCPPPTRDFNLIPSSYRDWYYDLFEKGKRSEPPLLPGEAGIIQVEITLIQSTDNFEIEMIEKFGEDLLYYNVLYGHPIAKTKEKIYFGKEKYKVSPDVEFMFTEPDLDPILVKIEGKRIKFHSLSGKKIRPLDLECTDKMIVDNHLYLKNEGSLIELDTETYGSMILPLAKTIWSIERKSSHLFAGVVYQSIFGKASFGIPLPRKNSFITATVPELDDYKVVDAKHDNLICVVTAVKDGIYTRFIIIFAPDYKSYRIRTIDDIDYSPINFVVLANGVCIMMNHDDTIEIFLNRIDKPAVKKIQDPEVNSSMRLCKDGVRVLFLKENKLYSIKTK